MQFRLGYDANQIRDDIKTIAEIDYTRTINAHTLFFGDSGTGKTTQLRRCLNSLVNTSQTPLRIHVFDSHGDIDVTDASTVLFSEAASWGLNPLEVNPNTEYGGVRRTINAFIKTINRTTHKLGSRQETCLRNLLTELYAQFNMYAEDPGTWQPKEERIPKLTEGRVYLVIPYEERESAKRAGCKFDFEAKLWYVDQHTGASQRWPVKVFGRRQPTLHDLMRLADASYKSVFLGANKETVMALDRLSRKVKHLHDEVLKRMKTAGKAVTSEEDLAAMEEELDVARREAVTAFQTYVLSLDSGRELESLMKYDSETVLSAVRDRVRVLVGTGIFKNIAPPFDPEKPVWRYNIAPLSSDEKLLFVNFSLGRLFDQAIQRGPTATVQDIVVIDEAAQYINDDPDDILNRIIREARKFGLAVILASQSPEHMSMDLLSQVAVKIVLGLDRSQWPAAQRKLGIDTEGMAWIIPKQRALVLRKVIDAPGTQAIWTLLPRSPALTQQRPANESGEAPTVSQAVSA